MARRLLTRDELASELLQVRPSTVERWTRQGRIPVIQPTAKVQRYDLDDVIAAIKTPRETTNGESQNQAGTGATA